MKSSQIQPIVSLILIAAVAALLSILLTRFREQQLSQDATATPALTASPTQPASPTPIPTDVPSPTSTPMPALTRVPVGDWSFELADSGAGVLAFSKDGKLLAHGLPDGTVSIWDVASGTKRATLGKSDGCCGDQITSVAFSPDGSVIAAAKAFAPGHNPPGRGIDLWSLPSGEFLRSLPGEWRMWQIAFSPDGKILAGSSDGGQNPTPGGKVLVWDTETWSQRYELDAVAPPIAFTPDSTTLITKSGMTLLGWSPQMGTYPIEFWDVASGTRTRTLEVGGYVVTWALSPDASKLAMCTIEAAQDVFNSPRHLLILDTATGKTATEMKIDVTLQSVSIVFSPNGSLLVTTLPSDMLIVWDARTGERLATYRVPMAWPNFPVFSPDGKLLALATNEGKIDAPGRIIFWQTPWLR